LANDVNGAGESDSESVGGPKALDRPRAEKLAHVLPQAVDKMTPDGKIPTP
jgi:uncharacterized protein YidB (DUF937 family)